MNRYINVGVTFNQQVHVSMHVTELSEKIFAAADSPPTLLNKGLRNTDIKFKEFLPTYLTTTWIPFNQPTNC